ncbi:hypothetical protein [Halodesulfovibrio sp. MK-HDV]|jgi:hypothetical protein|uniref:hypothetical protein n=1 Tax=Halodesulfovibrio sp. MK-HDV TaxID=2599925 RepID=UPI00136DE195|nr:hypothetical protein [Halodesulfovibrio sp. MK-HDV]KAF1073605.1 hypothetical protein MKHDV_03447 [Halodesulfovibrio sp. MK-HDV]
MSVVPVQMAGSIFLDSGWQSMLMPVISAFASVLVTWFIISKSTKEMKALIKQNKDIEERKLAFEDHKHWLETVVDALADYCACCDEYESLLAERKIITVSESSVSPEQRKDVDIRSKENVDHIRAAKRKLSHSSWRLICYLDLNNPKHDRLFQKVHELEMVAKDSLKKTDSLEKLEWDVLELLDIIQDFVKCERAKLASPVDTNP